jgi:flagellar motility protein MotE (MotC chaperone)
MRSCDIKRDMRNKTVAYRAGWARVLCAGLLSLFLAVVADISIVPAQEKTTNKTAAKSQTGKTATTTVASASSLEEERLKILNADMQAKLDQLKKLKQEIEAFTKGLDAKKKEQLVRVVKMYESMPAEEAAKAMARLDDDTAIQILTTIKSRNAGQILGLMDPGRVASLSKKAIFRGRLPKEKSSP